MSDTTKYVNQVSLTLNVKSVAPRGDYVIGAAEMIFTPMGKDSFAVPVSIVAKADETVAAAVAVGLQNITGKFAMKEYVPEGSTEKRHEYSIYPSAIKPAKPTDAEKPWRAVSFTVWSVGDPAMKYGSGGNAYTIQRAKLGMGKGKAPFWFDLKAFTVGGNDSLVTALNDVTPGSTLLIHGKLDAYKAESGKIYFSVGIFPPRVDENGETKGPMPLTIVESGEPKEEPAADAAAIASGRSYGFSGFGH